MWTNRSRSRPKASSRSSGGAPGPSGGGAEEERLLVRLLVLVEQHHHQAGPAAEPPEQRALADARGRRDVVHRDRVGAAFGDQPAGRVEQQRAVAGGVAALVRGRSVPAVRASSIATLTSAL